METKDYSKMNSEELTHEVNVLEAEQINDSARIGQIKETQRWRDEVIGLIKARIQLLTPLENNAA